MVSDLCFYLRDVQPKNTNSLSKIKDAIVVVICPLNALIDSHILEVKENPKTVNTRKILFR